MAKTTTRNIKKALLKKTKLDKPSRKNWLSLGTTMGNLACTGYPFGALMPGKAYLWVGGSGDGKTAEMCEIMARACIHPFYDDYKIYNDDPEFGNNFDMTSRYSQEIADRILPPAGTADMPIYSETPQDFFRYLKKKCLEGPCIYILDSMDALIDKTASQRMDANDKAAEDGKDIENSYGTEKAKYNYDGYRRALPWIQKSGSIVILVAHKKQNINKVGWGQEYTRAGGAAMKFFATLEIWHGRKGTLQAEFKKNGKVKKMKVGFQMSIDVLKNRSSGKQRSVEVPYYYETGIDDTGSCVDFLVEYGYWKKSDKGFIEAKHFKKRLRREPLIAYIENFKHRHELRLMVWGAWKEVEAAVSVHRVSEFKKG